MNIDNIAYINMPIDTTINSKEIIEKMPEYEWHVTDIEASETINFEKVGKEISIDTITISQKIDGEIENIELSRYDLERIYEQYQTLKKAFKKQEQYENELEYGEMLECAECRKKNDIE